MARKKKHPGNITKRSAGVWRVKLCVGGKYSNYTVKGTRTEAENFATVKHAELSGDVDRVREGLPGAVRFSELLKHFEDYELPAHPPGGQRSYKNSFAPFRAYFVDKLGDPPVRKIRRAHVKSFIQWRRTYRVGGEGGVSNHTVARDFRVLHRLLNYALDLDYVDFNAAHKVRAPKSDPRSAPILTPKQLDELLKHAEPNPMLWMYILLLAETGMRAYSEALQLRWDDIDFGGGFIHVRSAPGRRTKSGRSRHVPMTSRLREALQAHAARFRLAVYTGGRSPFVFHHIITKRNATAGERIRDMKEAFATAIKAAKLPAGFRPHDLRHRRVTTWLADGKSAVLVKEAVGHADLATTMKYTHLKPEHLRALVAETPSVPLGERTGA